MFFFCIARDNFLDAICFEDDLEAHFLLLVLYFSDSMVAVS